jgi:hypothetical protein
MSNLKVNIICKIHGEFEQIASSHLIGQGCPRCGIIKRSEIHKYDTNIFIEKANKIHKNKYDYSKVDYINIDTKIIILCKLHGEFEQTPYGHLSGNNCPKCVGGVKYTIDDFTITNNNLYEKSIVYVNGINKYIHCIKFYSPVN